MSLYGNNFYIEQNGFEVTAFVDGVELERVKNITYQGESGLMPLVTIQFYPAMFELNTKKKMVDTEDEMSGLEEYPDEFSMG